MDRSTGGQKGIGIVEVFMTILLLGLLIIITLPALRDMYVKRQVQSASQSVQRIVRFARTNAVKEKETYRLIINDENAITPNLVQLERLQGGSYVAVSGQSFTPRYGVRILGSGSTDSMDTLTIGPRGRCNSGSVYLSGKQGIIRQVDIEATCATRIP